MDELNFLDELIRNIGQTVTIFTTSGGESGSGFTGVLTMANNSFVRLVVQLGPGPGCALGNCCDKDFPRGETEGTQLGERGRAVCTTDRLGTIVDIPLTRIAAFVHNSVGSN